jgi:hypothetical protein
MALARPGTARHGSTFGIPKLSKFLLRKASLKSACVQRHDQGTNRRAGLASVQCGDCGPSVRAQAAMMRAHSGPWKCRPIHSRVRTATAHSGLDALRHAASRTVRWPGRGPECRHICSVWP